MIVTKRRDGHVVESVVADVRLFDINYCHYMYIGGLEQPYSRREGVAENRDTIDHLACIIGNGIPMHEEETDTMNNNKR